MPPTRARHALLPLLLLAPSLALCFVAPAARLAQPPTMKYTDGISYQPLSKDNTPVGATSIYAAGPPLSAPVPPPPPGALRGSSVLFLDTAESAAWAEHLPLGLFRGITTNPVLLERAGVECSVRSLDALSGAAFAAGVGEFMCQAWGGSSGELVKVGTELARLDPRIVVKVPLTTQGIQAGAALASRGARVCMTACYAPHQVLTSAAIGAEYVAPYLGRMTDEGKDGFSECVKMQRILTGLNSRTRLLVASIREAADMAALAAEGCDTFTFSPAVAAQLGGDALTATAAADFEGAAARMCKGGGKRRSIGFQI